MANPILATKLYIPPPPKVVVRPRLLERMNKGLHRKLALNSAAAGCGKTTRVRGAACAFRDQVSTLASRCSIS